MMSNVLNQYICVYCFYMLYRMDSQSQGGSKMDISQGSQSGRGKNKRFWTKDEEWALVNGLLELSADPGWKAEGNFKSGYQVKLESMLNEKFPTCGLKAYPHIDSKTKWFRDKYNVITEMLRTSGFSWDDTTKTIKCERQSYEDFCKVCPIISSTLVKVLLSHLLCIYHL